MLFYIQPCLCVYGIPSTLTIVLSNEKLVKGGSYRPGRDGKEDEDPREEF